VQLRGGIYFRDADRDLAALNLLDQLGHTLAAHNGGVAHRPFADAEKIGGLPLRRRDRQICRLGALPHGGDLCRHHRALALIQVLALELERDHVAERVGARPLPPPGRPPARRPRPPTFPRRFFPRGACRRTFYAATFQ